MVVKNLQCLTPDEKYIKLWKVNSKGNDWIFASRKSRTEAIFYKTSPDAVSVVSLIDTGGEVGVVICREYRPALGGYEDSLPSGLIEKGETVYSSAVRELFEETGLVVKNKLLETDPMHVSSGLTDESYCLVAVEAEGEITNSHNEETEEIKPFILKIKDIDNYLENREYKISSRLWFTLNMLKMGWLSESFERDLNVQSV